MQRTLFELLNRDHILLDIEAAHGRDTIQKLTAPLVETGHVEPGFAEDAWEREQEYPTGLPTQPYAVAIPHADPDHVIQSAVCFGTLQDSVPFGQMGSDGSTELDVEVVILLAIREREKQPELIQQVVSLIQSPQFLDKLVRQETSESALQLIRDTLKKLATD